MATENGQSTPKLPLTAKLFNSMPKTGLLGKLRSLLVSVWRLGGPVSAVPVVFKVIRTYGFGYFFRLIRNAANMNTEGVQVPYEQWARRFIDLSRSDIQNLVRKLAEVNEPPKISILMPTYNSDPEFLELAIDSVLKQIYPNWELCIADDASTDEICHKIIKDAANRDSRIKFVLRTENGQISEATNSCLALATGEYVTFLDHDDELTIDALAAMAISASENPNVVFFYSDEDKIDAVGKRSAPHFKPELNRTLALSMNYFCHLSMYKTTQVRELGGLRSAFDGAQDYDLALRMLEILQDSQIMHVPHVLYHWRISQKSTSWDIQSKPYALDASRSALEAHLERQGISAEISPNENLTIYNKAIPSLIFQPSVSIIIPTRDQAEILSNCIESISTKSTYSAVEIIVVNNGSVEQRTLDYFKTLRAKGIKVLDYPGAFNYSAINNFAVAESIGEYVCLLNNDTEVLTHDWLEQMLGFAQLPRTGAVGAKLLYPDGRIQHAGVVLGLGGLSSLAGHAHRFLDSLSPGYMGRAQVTHEISAVTGACILVAKSKYLEVGGLTEELTVGFNDVDFCLKLLAAGYKNIFCPHAQLIHFESISRGLDTTLEQIQRASGEAQYMLAHWDALLNNDPSYNRHLTGNHEDFSLAWPPRKSKALY